MMDELEFVTPPPVQISSRPASFMRSSYSPRGNGNTRSSFCRSTHRCASPGLSSVSLPIWYIVTTTTLTGIGASPACDAALKARFSATAKAPSTPDLSDRVFIGIPPQTIALVGIPACREKTFIHRLVREDLLAGEAGDLVREHQPPIGCTHIEVGDQIAAIPGRFVVDGRDPNLLRRVAPAAAPQFGNDRLETASRVEHIVDQQQLVFRVERGDQVVDRMHTNRAALLVYPRVR